MHFANIILKASLLLAAFGTTSTFAQDRAGTSNSDLPKAVVNAPPGIAAPVGIKASTAIIDKAMKGLPQDLYLAIDMSDTDKDVDLLRPAGRDYDTQEVVEERSRRYRERKQTRLAMVRQFNISEIEDFPNLALTKVRVPNMRALERLISLSDVRSLYEPFSVTLSGSNNLGIIGQPAARSDGKLGNATRVAVIDTGIDYNAGAFGDGTIGCRWPGQNSPGYDIGGQVCRIFSYRSFVNARTSFDEDTAKKHGSNIAGIVAAVAPATKLDVLKIFYTNVQNEVVADSDALIRALDWVVANAQAGATKITAVNLSIAFPDVPRTATECPNSILAGPFARLRSAGVLPVVATGNNHDKSRISDPACAPGAVRVGAIYDSQVNGFAIHETCRDEVTAPDQVTCFSNSSPILTLLAPGHLIVAGNAIGLGTSQAAAHVSGAIAILRAFNAFPNETISTTTSRMVNSGRMIADRENGLVRPRLDISAALKYAFPTDPGSGGGGSPASSKAPIVQGIANDLILQND